MKNEPWSKNELWPMVNGKPNFADMDDEDAINWLRDASDESILEEIRSRDARIAELATGNVKACCDHSAPGMGEFGEHFQQ